MENPVSGSIIGQIDSNNNFIESEIDSENEDFIFQLLKDIDNDNYIGEETIEPGFE